MYKRQGEPDFETPDNIKLAGIKAIVDGKSKYTPAAGIPGLRQAVAYRLKMDFNLDYDPNEIVIASGAKHNVFISLVTLLDPGDEVIVPAPYWVTYTEAVAMAGGRAVVVTADEKQQFKITPQQLEAAITDKSKVLLINNPSNPTGMLYSKEELEALCQICVKHDLYIICLLYTSRCV